MLLVQTFSVNMSYPIEWDPFNQIPRFPLVQVKGEEILATSRAIDTS